MTKTEDLPAHKRALYIDQQGGRIVCFNHLGFYGKSDVDHNPDQTVWVTPLDVWVRATKADNDEWVKEFGKNLKCEDCPHEYKEV